MYYTSFRDGFQVHLGAAPGQRHEASFDRAPVPIFIPTLPDCPYETRGRPTSRLRLQKDKLVFNMGELRGNLWMATFQKETAPRIERASYSAMRIRVGAWRLV